MNDQTINLALTYLAATGTATYLLQALQRWSKTPWISEHTTRVNVTVRMALAVAASAGLHWGWSSGADNSHVLTIAIPPAMVLVKGIIHLVGQYFAQHLTGKVVSLPETPKSVPSADVALAHSAFLSPIVQPGNVPQGPQNS